MVRLPGGGPTGSSRAVSIRDKELGVAFRHDPATPREVGKVVDWIAAQEVNGAQALPPDSGAGLDAAMWLQPARLVA